MAGKWHLGGDIQPNGFHGDLATALTNPNNDWSMPIKGGAQDLGFDSSIVTHQGVQGPPYSFFRNGLLVTEVPKNVKYWKIGAYPMPNGITNIQSPGEGDKEWDSTAYSMKLVEETTNFIDDHLTGSRANDPFFAYVALGAVHTPYSPPNFYFGKTKVAGQYPTQHMDMLSEVDLVVGSLMKALADRGLMSDTLIIFTSDNGGWGSSSLPYGHITNGPLHGNKASIWEGGHRVPLIMRYDGGNFPAGATRSHLVGLNDIFSTVCEIAGVQVPPGQAKDSISFASYIKSEQVRTGLRQYLAIWLYSLAVPQYK